MNKILIFVLSIILLTLTGTNFYIINSLDKSSVEFGNVNRYMSINTIASSTVFTLTTTAQRLLSTTTSPYNRVAATIQAAGCTAAGVRVHLNIGEAVATSATGPALTASTTESIEFNTYNNPVGNGQVTGITNSGTCTVVVTEWVALR